MFSCFGKKGRSPRRRLARVFGPALVAAALLSASSCNNNPYGQFAPGRVMYSAMSSDIRTLDPTRVSDSSSGAIASNIHDTPYEFHYLKRPLVLIPSMATGMPQQGRTTLDGLEYPTFRFSIKRGLRFADDDCFQGGKGREIKIDDLILAIKRAADSSLDPFGQPLLTGRVVGFAEYSKALEAAYGERAELEINGKGAPPTANANSKSADPSAHPNPVAAAYARDISGVRKLDDYTLELVMTRKNPVIKYFFAQIMSSPIPAECLAYYSGKAGRPTYDRHPVASGPYFVREWHANYRINLERNPNYRRDDYYPAEGEAGDEAAGLLDLKGTPLPMLDRVQIQMISAVPPLWTLFDQGYLDRAGIPRDVYSEVIVQDHLSDKYEERGVKLNKEIEPVTFWFYFNMQDPLFAKNKLLRQALSLALDRDEFIERFNNNRAIVAESILPPGFEGYDPDYRNPFSRFDLPRARELLARAGYKDGIDPKTGKSLKITMTQVAHPSATSQYRYYIESFRELGIDFKIEALDWPTVLERKNKKNFQMIHGGWGADYPDPQNFLQLFYGPNSSTPYNENSYRNAEFDALYDKMKNMEPGPEREAIIFRMRDIMNEDASIVYLYHRLNYVLSHKWMAPFKPHPIGLNQLKYRTLDPQLRAVLVEEWNRPSPAAYVLPAVLALLLGLLGWLAVREYGKLGA